MGAGEWLSAFLTGTVTLNELRCFIRDGADPGIPLRITSEFQPNVYIDGNVGVDLHSELGDTIIMISLVEDPGCPPLFPQTLIDYLDDAATQYGHWREVVLGFIFYRWRNNRGYPPNDAYGTATDWRPVFDKNEPNLIIIKGLVRTGEEFDNMGNVVPLGF